MITSISSPSRDAESGAGEVILLSVDFSGGGESGSTGRDDEDQVMNESSPGEIEKFLSRFLQDAMENTQCGRDYSDKAQAEMQSE